MYFVREFVDAGGLMSFGLNLTPLYKRSAWYVDRILRGKTGLRICLSNRRQRTSFSSTEPQQERST